MSFRRALIGMALAGPLVVAGCSSRPPPLAPVQGRVTFAGSPLTRGVIVFTPDSDRGSYGPCASGEIGPDGRYSLATDQSAGATPGWHRVTIAALDTGFGVRLPERFRDPNLSRLRAEIRAGQSNVVDFRLEGP